MRQLLHRLTALTFLICLHVTVHAQWNVLGAPGITSGAALNTSIAIDGAGVPYVAFLDGANSYKISVMKYNASTASWALLGPAAFSPGGANYISLAIDGTGVPYVAFEDYANNYKATVMKYSAATDSWSVVGSAGFSAWYADYTTLAIDGSGTPYVAYADHWSNDAPTVMKYSTSTNSWNSVGSAAFGPNYSTQMSLAIDGSGVPYLAFGDQSKGYKASVMKYSSGTGTWSFVGTAGFTPGSADFPSLAISGGVPYLAFKDNGNASKASVRKYNSVTGSWDAVGPSAFSSGSINYSKLRFDGSGIPYVAFSDGANSDKAAVMKYNASTLSWSIVDAAGFSAGQATAVSLALDGAGNPHVAYIDAANSNKATVMKYTPPPGKALNFDGTNDYVDLSNNSVYNAFPLTAECWIKTTTTSGFVGFINKYISGSGNGWQLGTQNGYLQSYYYKDISNYASIYDNFSSGLFVADGNWHYVALTVDASGAKLYVDGVNQASATWVGTPQPVTTTTNLLLGSYPYPGSFFNGTMDEVRIWKRALCQDEIQAHINCELTGPQNGLITYYKFNQGVAGANNPGVSTATDYSGNGNAGTLQNFALNGATSNWVAPGAVSNACAAVTGTPPSITSVVPAAAMPGQSVVIAGSNFGASSSSNTVYFGAAKATITAASSTALTVTVPAGATYAPVSVTTSSCIGQAAYSPSWFTPTYCGNQILGSTSFTSQTTFTTYDRPFSVALGDLNGDGKNEMIVANYYPSYYMSVFKNTATMGTINSSSFAARQDYAAKQQPYYTLVHDMDGDGKLDVVVACQQNGGSVYLNTSSGSTVSLGTRFDLPSGNYSVAVGDLDNDGKPDLVFAGSNIYLYKNNSTPGNLSFVAAGSLAVSVIHVAVSDFDGDGKADIVGTSYGNSQLAVYQNQNTPGALSSSSFAAQTPITTQSGPYGLSVADFDGDGKADVATQCRNTGVIQIFRNTSSGAGNFAWASPIGLSGGYSILGTDITGDGKPDIIRGGSPIQVFVNNSAPGNLTAGSFIAYSTSNQMAYGNDENQIAVGDIDGDGKPEMISTNDGDNSIGRPPFVSVGMNNVRIASPTVTASGATALCQGSSVTLTASNGASYQWLLNNAVIAGANGQTCIATTAGNYAVTVTNSTGCSATSAPIAVTVTTASAPLVSSPVTITCGQAATLTATPASGNSVRWFTSATGGTAFATGNSTNVSPIANTTYYAEGFTTAGSFVTSIATSGATAYEHNTITGDDRGGIAISPNYVYYTGDSYTGRFDRSNLQNATSLAQRDGFFSDLNGNLWQLSTAGSNGASLYGGGIITKLYGLTEALSTSGTVLNLSSSLNISSGSLIAPGQGFVIIYYAGTFYKIDLITGSVNTIGTGTISFSGPESWAAYGWAEFDGANYYIVYVSDAATITKRNVTTGSSATLQSFSSLSDMAAIIFDPSLSRMYFHHEGFSQFRSGDETIGFVGVTATSNGASCVSSSRTPLAVSVAPITVTVTAGGPTTFCQGGSVLLTASAGSSYQWSNAATTRSVTVNTSGNYSVTVTNANGCSATSLPTAVTVNPLPTASISGTTTICNGTSTDIVFSGTPNAVVSYNVTANPIQTITLDATGAATLAVAPSNNTTYTIVSVTSSDNCTALISNQTATITVNKAPSFAACPSDIAINNDPGLCTKLFTYAAVATGTPAPAVSYAFTGTTTGAGTGTGSGSTFNHGTTNIAVTATNTCGTANCNFWVNVIDNQIPVLTCPVSGSTARNTNTGACGYTIQGTELDGTATDNCSVSLSWELSGALNTNGTGSLAGTVLPKGTTFIKWKANDGNGHEVSCLFIVIVTDNQPPTITAPADVTVTSNPGQCYASNVTLGTATANDNCSVTVSNNAPTSFPLGNTTVTWTATDGANTSTATQIVTVNAPQLQVEANSSTISNGATLVSSQDNTDFGGTLPGMPVTRTFTLRNAGTANLSVSSVTLSGADAANFSIGQFNGPTTIGAGNSSTFTVSFTATTLGTYNAIVNVYSDDCNDPIYTYAVQAQITCSMPAFTVCPSNILTSTTVTGCDNVVTYAASFSGLPTPAINHSFNGNALVSGDGSGSTFSKGITHVVLSATNACGTANCSFDVTVEDHQNPTVAAPIGLSVNADAGKCYATITDLGMPTFNDNCSGATIANNAPASRYPIGTTTVTWTATDASNNTATATQTITVADNQAPVPAVAVLSEVTGECTASVTAPMATDNCAGTLLASTADPLSYASQGTYTVHWAYSDGNGNNTYQEQTVTVRDVTKPDITCPLGISHAADAGLCSYSVSPGIATATDNCSSSVTIAGLRDDNLALNAPYPVGLTTITWSAEDGNGNTQTCAQLVTVTDNQAPVITGCPQTVIAHTGTGRTSCDQIATWTAPTAVDNCGSVTSTSSHNPGDLFPVGTTTVTYTFTDAHSNSSACTFDVTVIDDTKPVVSGCPGNLTVKSNDGNPLLCVQTATWVEPTATDNCGGALNYFSRSNAPGSTFLLGANNVSYVFKDPAGNSETCAFIVTVEDNTRPVITTNGSRGLSNDVGKCGASVLVTASANDNCSVGSPVGVRSDSQPVAVDYPVGTTSVTWNVTDANNVTAVPVIQSITVTDNEAPTITPPAGTVSANTSDDGGFDCATSVAISNVATADNCSVTKLTWTMDGATTDASPTTGINQVGTHSFNKGITNIRYTVTDASNNMSAATVTVTVNDNEAPILVGVPASTSVSCSSIPGVPVVTAYDNCNPSLAVVYSQGTTQSTNPAQSSYYNYTITRTWTATDAANLSTTLTQTITVSDSTPPTITAPASVTAGTSDNGGYDCGTTVVLGSPIVSDNCAPVANLTVTASVAGTQISPASYQFQKGTTVITWNVKDVIGNTNTATQNVTVIDNENPTINAAGLTPANGKTSDNGVGDCTTTVALGTPTISDNCTGIASLVASVNGAPIDPATNLFPIGQTIVRWTVTDGSGHSSYIEQTVTVTDDEKPAITAPTVITAHTADNGGYDCTTTVNLGTPSTTDNCTGTISVEARVNGNVINPATYPFGIGTTTVYWTATDAHGNTSLPVTQSVTVLDDQAPTAKCKVSPAPITLVSGTGSVPVTAALIDDGSFDNCASNTLSYSVAPTSFNCSSIGSNPATNTVILTVDDGKGHTATCSSVMTVIGEIPSGYITVTPSDNTYTGGVVTNVYLGYGPQTDTLKAISTGTSPITSYSWGGSTLSGALSPLNAQKAAFVPASSGTYNYSVTLTNAYGCTSQSLAMSVPFCVKDIRVPGANDKVYLCHASSNNATNTLSVSTNAVASHLTGHAGDRLGLCDQACGTTTARTLGGSNYLVGEEVKIYPNPNSGSFTVELPYIENRASITIMDVTGKMIQRLAIGYNDGYKFNLNLGDVAKGIYMVDVIYDDKQFRTKLLIQ